MYVYMICWSPSMSCVKEAVLSVSSWTFQAPQPPRSWWMLLEPVQVRRRMLLHFHSPEKSLFQTDRNTLPLNLSFQTHWTTLQQEGDMTGEQQKHISVFSTPQICPTRTSRPDSDGSSIRLKHQATLTLISAGLTAHTWSCKSVWWMSCANTSGNWVPLNFRKKSEVVAIPHPHGRWCLTGTPRSGMHLDNNSESSFRTSRSSPLTFAATLEHGESINICRLAVLLYLWGKHLKLEFYKNCCKHKLMQTVHIYHFFVPCLI